MAARRSGPLGERVAGLVLERADDDQDEVDQHPDAEPPEGDQLQDPGADLADIEAVNAEKAEEQAQEHRREDALVRGAGRRLPGTARGAGGRGVMQLLAASA